MSTQDFMNNLNLVNIKRGWIFEAIVPYVSERPLDFYIPESKGSVKGTIQNSNGNFIPSETQMAVFKLKQRKVCIISNDELCQNNSIYDISVAPIYGIYEDDKEMSWYTQALSDDHIFYTYLSEEITGKECVIDLSNIITINKNMLLKDKFDASSRMDQVEKCIEYCLSVGMYKKKENKEEDVS